MESITITFLESSPDGVRRLTTNNWSGACLVISREHFASARRVEDLMRPGVYILVGPSEINMDGPLPRLVSRIYIGKSDVLDERLRNHYDGKMFWSTAFAFYREGKDDLHGGQTAQLEALLIARARAAGNNVVTNVATPKQTGKTFDSESTASFAMHIEVMLKALGYDFFSPRPILLSESVPAAKEEDVVVPLNLLPVVNEVKQICSALPATEFYSTHVPDLRAKVMHEGSTRVFARIQFQKHAVKLTMKGGPTMILEAQAGVPEHVAEELRLSHDRAQKHLAE